MTPRDTRTGGVLEKMVLPALERGGYTYRKSVNIGKRLGGGKHIVDVLASDRTGSYLVSLKWQQVSGTTEQKVPFEAMCLADAAMGSRKRYEKAYLVLGGAGWKLREFFVGGGLKKYLLHTESVNIISLEAFVAKANKGQL